MKKFINKKTGKIQNAYSIRTEGNKTYVKFSAQGTEYAYNSENITELTKPEPATINSKDNSFILYSYKKDCWRCHSNIDIYTYIVFSDGTYESATYPWDKPRALEYQNLECHMMDESIEYYGISVVGQIPKFDRILLEKYPNMFSMQYSNVLRRSYCANTCPVCKALQGMIHTYKDVNVFIYKMQKLDVFDKINYDI